MLALIAPEVSFPGEPKHWEGIKLLNEKQLVVLDKRVVKSRKNTVVFDAKAKFLQDHIPFSVGQLVKLHNKAYTMGSAWWFGPFKFKQVLDNNVYILVDQAGNKYSRPVTSGLEAVMSKIS